MSRRAAATRYAVLLPLSLLLLSLLTEQPPALSADPVQVDPYILEQMAASTEGQAGFFVRFREQVNLSAAYTIPDWDLRGRFVHDMLRATAVHSQARVQGWLDAQGIAYVSFVVPNALFVTADRPLLDALRAFPEVAALRGNHTHPLEPIRSAVPAALPQGVAWNIRQIGADRVWQDFGVRGQGIVVANIDTGVEYTHEALFANYKCGWGPHEDCWYDPANVCPSALLPCDNEGHGTHVMGTMAAGNAPTLPYQVGIAPEARWIACKGCESETCSDFALTACADWILAPNGDPANRPHVVNNSWGGAGCDDWYQPQVQAWRAAGIFPAFSIGNGGPACGTTGSPGDLPEAFASGATDSEDQIAWFSSRGPSCWDEVKPEVVAPGVGVCSSVPGNEWSCSYSGTSMASPHTAGLVALLWSADPGLIGQIEATERAITSTAVCLESTVCDGEPCHNNVYGWGRIDAYKAVLQAGFGGTLSGQVTAQDSGTPLAGVDILAQEQSGSAFQASTNAAGLYTLTVPAGSYTLSASLYAFYPQTATGVPVLTGTTTGQDFVLQPRPCHTISGTVTEAGTGIPLGARITVKRGHVESAWTDPATGYYSLTLVEGTYPARAAALLHLSQRVELDVNRDRTVRFALEPGTCTLLVDDDGDQPDLRSFYTATLDGLGLSYKVWDVAQRGPPGVEDLLGHHNVFWWTGNDNDAPLSSADETVLQAYLAARGNLFLSSQSYLRGGAPLNDFQQDFLHIGSFAADTLEIDPLGNSGDPIGGGLGPFLLVPPPGWEGPLRSDQVTHDGYGGASAPFRWQGSGQDNSTDYDGGSLRTVFLAWPFAGLSSPLARRTVLDAALNFFGPCQPNGLLLGQVLDANTGEPLDGAAVVPVPEGPAGAAPGAFTGPAGHFTFTLPAGSYELTTYRAGYIPEVIGSVSVSAGLMTYLEVSLRSPRLNYDPATFSWTLPWEGQFTDALVLSNAGSAGPLEWLILPREGPTSHTPARQEPLPGQPLVGRAPADESPMGEMTSPLSLTGHPEVWSYKEPLPSGRYRGAAFPGPGEALFLVGGFKSNNVCLSDNLRYDPEDGTWTRRASMPTARANVQAAVVDNIAYLPGGYCDGLYYSTLEAYDIDQDAWTAGLSPLPEPRSGAMVAAVGGRIYACGGSPGPSARCWAYDPLVDTWAELAAMPAPNAYGAAFEYRGFLYVVAGWTGAGSTAVFWRYDPQADLWEVGPPLQQGRMSPAVSVYGDEIYVIGGGGPGYIWDPNPTGERYNLDDWPWGSWELLPEAIPTPVVAPADGCSTDLVRVVGGISSSIHREHQALDQGRSCYRPAAQEAPPWLQLEPISGSLALGTRQTVTLRLDAGMVSDPACYSGRLVVSDNTVYGARTIPLTLCVTPTPDLGKLQGTVQGQGYCDRDPAPLNTAVTIEGSAGTSWTIPVNSSGLYYRWLHAGAYTVTAGAPDHLTHTVVVEVQPAQTTTLDLSLRYLTPCLGLWPRTFTLYVPTGTLLQYALTLSDAGALGMSWQAQEALLPAPFYRFPEAAGGPAGGSDLYGYTYVDSVENGGVTYQWLDLAAGTELVFDSSFYATATLPFTFSFYGVPLTAPQTLRVGGHGTLFRGSYGGYYNECLPSERYDWLIAPFWDRLEYTYGQVYAATLGAPPHRMLALEWQEMPVSLAQLTKTVSFELVLFEGSSDILFQYRDVTASSTSADRGASATVGIQNDFYTQHLGYSCNQPVLTDSLAICFEPPGSIPGCGVAWEDVPWLRVHPTAGEIPADGTQVLNVLLDTAGLEPGIYRAAVGIASDDARRPVVYVPVTLMVGLEHQVYLPLLARGNTPAGD